MALAVASTTTTSAGNNTTVNAAKPSGLAEGDLMLAFFMRGDNTDIPGTPSAPAGWELIDEIQTFRSKSAAYRKIASSSDAAASTFSFSDTESLDTVRVVMLRVTASGSLPTNPVVTMDESSVPATATTLVHSLDVDIPGSDSLIFVTGVSTNTSGVSGYTTNGTNPTWTEVFDNGLDTNYNGIVLYGDPSVGQNVSSFTLTVTQTGSQNNVILFFTVAELNSPDTDISHITVTPGIEGITATQVNVASDISMVDASPTLEGIETKATAPTQWTNETKPSTTWTNEQK